MPFHKPILILILFVTVSQLVAVTEPQNIPPAIVRELEQNGINVSEALELANKLGLDLSNPQMAALRARQAGIPEGKIQELLKIAAELKDQNQPSSTGLPHTTVRDFWGADSLLLESARVGNAAYHQLAGAEPPSPYFGYDLFRNIPRNFEFSPVGPVDDSYIVGFGDDLRLTVWGAAEFQYDLQVDREGRIYIPNVGQFTTAGKPLKQARSDLKRWLSRTYNGLRSTPPTIFMDLTLTRLRPIKIFVLGEVAQPGGYTVTNSSTVFNAIYSVGGPLESGSLREIKVIRNGKVITTVDLYDFLLSGLKHSQVRLTDNDHVFIPLRGKTVT
ncbi:MAG: polysaccharide biosynthesis/export family protein, partial [Candidatus Marinimicrobia bacterium]|nr:polysaccharide biosynthesis/export family protein [Candidatus Neomarinimicrobiota bacterium]